MVQQLQALVAFQEDPGLAPSIHVMAEGIQYSLLDSFGTRHVHGTHAHMHAKHSYTQKPTKLKDKPHSLTTFRFKSQLKMWIILFFIKKIYLKFQITLSSWIWVLPYLVYFQSMLAVACVPLISELTNPLLYSSSS